MIAHDRVVNGRKDLLIVILKEKINVDKLPEELKPYIRKFTNLYLVTMQFSESRKQVVCNFVLFLSCETFQFTMEFVDFYFVFHTLTKPMLGRR